MSWSLPASGCSQYSRNQKVQSRGFEIAGMTVRLGFYPKGDLAAADGNCSLFSSHRGAQAAVPRPSSAPPGVRVVTPELPSALHRDQCRSRGRSQSPQHNHSTVQWSFSWAPVLEPVSKPCATAVADTLHTNQTNQTNHTLIQCKATLPYQPQPRLRLCGDTSIRDISIRNRDCGSAVLPLSIRAE